MTIDDKYNTILQSELGKRLRRIPHPNEVSNADFDADLVNETLWQIICDLNTRIELLEAKK